MAELVSVAELDGVPLGEALAVGLAVGEALAFLVLTPTIWGWSSLGSQEPNHAACAKPVAVPNNGVPPERNEAESKMLEIDIHKQLSAQSALICRAVATPFPNLRRQESRQVSRPLAASQAVNPSREGTGGWA